ncbi:histone-lysine N-methyltransferase SETMAR [Elysia marginata]|uniref:Histone-lysine N-methyltransferase SETMAR n=1 Tax=Elysia marginata TaxID=1093978 RepID=A0AAV4HPX1_9GAST|nr:histone-lysine N-methyltransferase SETMAR [Elysia marginata]
MVYIEFLERGQTVNSELYISTLRALKLRLRRVRRDKDSILQHNNARPHTSRQTQNVLRQLENWNIRPYHTLHRAPILSPLTIICFLNSRSA